MPNLKVETFKISDLSTYHKNPRRGDVDAIAESLKARGQYRPIVVNIGTHASHDYEILAGNHTYLAARISVGRRFRRPRSMWTMTRRRRSCWPTIVSPTWAATMTRLYPLCCPM